MLYPWPAPLVAATFLGRYQRFLAHMRLDDGRSVVAHCVNSGGMEGLIEPGARVWLTEVHSATRKLKYTWQWMMLDGVAVGTNTHLPNPFVGTLLERRLLPGFEHHTGFRAEVPYGKHSRVDFVVDEEGTGCWLEVKNCHLVYPDKRAYFPDSVSVRATEHLRELARIARKGGRATVCFVVQRDDAISLRPSEAHDPVFATAARAALKAGVRFMALRCRPEPEGLRYLDTIPVDLVRHDLGDVRKMARLAAFAHGMAAATRARGLTAGPHCP